MMQRFAIGAMVLLVGTWSAEGLAQDDEVKREGKTAPQLSTGTQPPGTATTRPAGAAETDVAVRVNGKVISEGEVRGLFQASMEARGMNQQQIDMMWPHFRDQVVKTFVENALLAPKVEAEEIEVSDEELRAGVEEDIERYLEQTGVSREFFEQQIKAQRNMTVDELIDAQVSDPLVRNRYLHAKLMEKLFPDKVKVAEADVEAYYKANQDERYSQETEVRASHILLGTRELSEQEKAEARKQAEELAKQAKQADVDFAELAREHSSCPSSAKGGDLGFFPRQGKMVEPFAKAAFDLKVGEVSDVVETQFGYHIIKVTERKEGKTTPLAEIEEEVREVVQQEKIREQLRAYIDKLKEQAKIEYPPGKEPKPPQPIMQRRQSKAAPSTQPGS